MISPLLFCVFAAGTGFSAAAETLTSASATTTATTTAPADFTRFDGERAFAHLKAQVNFGPRIPGNTGLTKTRSHIKSHLAQCGFTVETQTFSAKSDLLAKVVDGENLIGILPTSQPVKYIISAHYDTRPISDKAETGLERNKPVPGANDGASGVAVLLELATILKSRPTHHGIALVFFDLEDHGHPMSNRGFCMGSRHMAAHLPASLQSFSLGINLDMVGDRDLILMKEGNSVMMAREQVDRFWSVGQLMYPETFKPEEMRPIFDDHMPFLESGRPYIDVIDFEYPWWHTSQDSVDKCSGESLQIVGRTMSEFIRQ